MSENLKSSSFRQHGCQMISFSPFVQATPVARCRKASRDKTQSGEAADVQCSVLRIPAVGCNRDRSLQSWCLDHTLENFKGIPRDEVRAWLAKPVLPKFRNLDSNQLADGRSYMCASEDCESPGCECNTTSSRNAFFVMGSTEHQAASV